MGEGVRCGWAITGVVRREVVTATVASNRAADGTWRLRIRIGGLGIDFRSVLYRLLGLTGVPAGTG